MNSKISVIVPVYNCEQILERCVKSIQLQTYMNIEIILIDDGSTDNSGVLCDTYKKLDSRIVVIHKENGGVSATRNAGLDIATGEFISFVDSDDYIEANMIELLYQEVMKQEVELVICNYFYVKKLNKSKNERILKHNIYTVEEYLSKLTDNPFCFYYGVVWNKLFKKSIIEENNIRFQTNRKTGEDFLYNMQYLKHVNSVAVMDRYLYCYNVVSNSITRGKQVTFERIQNLFDLRLAMFQAYSSVFHYLKIYTKYEEDINLYWSRYIFEETYNFRHTYLDLTDSEKEMVKKILNHQVLSSSQHKVNIKKKKKLCRSLYIYYTKNRYKTKLKNIVKKFLYK